MAASAPVRNCANEALEAFKLGVLKTSFARPALELVRHLRKLLP